VILWLLSDNREAPKHRDRKPGTERWTVGHGGAGAAASSAGG